MQSTPRKDVLGQELRSGDFFAYSPAQAGMRIGMIIDVDGDKWNGQYMKRGVKAVILDYRNIDEAITKTTIRPDLIRMVKIWDLPEKSKQSLIEVAHGMGWREDE